jgi:hypothetical protein
MTSQQPSLNGRVLHSWKEIAAYMGRGVRTIQRYEAHLGLPVRRPSGAPRSAVLAFSQEIDQWLAKSPTRVEPLSNGHKAVPLDHAVVIDSLHRKVQVGQERAAAVQRRMEEMQVLVSQLTIRVQQSMERRKEMRNRSKVSRGVMGDLKKFKYWHDSAGEQKVEEPAQNL